MADEERDRVYREEYVPSKEKLKRAKDLLSEINGKKNLYSEMWPANKNDLNSIYDRLKDGTYDRNAGTLITYYNATCRNNQELFVEIVGEIDQAYEDINSAVSELEGIIDSLENSITSMKNEYDFVF